MNMMGGENRSDFRDKHLESTWDLEMRKMCEAKRRSGGLTWKGVSWPRGGRATEEELSRGGSWV